MEEIQAENQKDIDAAKASHAHTLLAIFDDVHTNPST
jgi:hypothetical protein